ncbi:MAG TPA: Rrf2 family transcriptional regulator [Elusimicrobiales bacterium]|nr:Rrf2 family transcriptional regulator [Elusimicrobiales bacterium]
MQSIIKISDAAAIAIHAADYLAGREADLSSAAAMAKALAVSYNHLSKVLQQLTRAGLVTAARGPKGGFALSAAGKSARVRDFIAAVDGPPVMNTCLLKHKVCAARQCIFGDFLGETGKRFEKVLNGRIYEIAKRGIGKN